jgi:CheY-like chemotaxis protein
MDVNLGEKLTGVDLTRHMRKNGDYTPVIIQTAYFRDYIIDDDIKYNGYIEKPINFPLLLEKIDNIFKKCNG